MDEDADWTPDTEYEEQDDIECEEDTDVPNKINKWKNTSFLSPEQEEDLVEWIRENDIFYNKGRRNSAKKDQLWADKAAELNVPEDDIRVWWKSMRTRYGKITKPSDETMRMTDRDKWIFDNLNFLDGHISRLKFRRLQSRSRCLLSDEQEENLVTWIRENELLYKKSLKAFKDTAKKEQLWRNKAEELNVTVVEIKMWWKSRRNKYARLSKSADESTQLAKKDKWILKRFQFLDEHIIRLSSRQSQPKSLNGQLSPSTSQQCMVLSTIEQVPGVTLLPNDPEYDSSTSSLNLPHKHSPTALIARSRNSVQGCRKSFPLHPDRRVSTESTDTADTDEDIDSVDTADRISDIQAQNDTVITPSVGSSTACPRTAWGQWMTSQMKDIHPRLWPQFQMKSLELIQQFKARSDNQFTKDNA